MADLLQSQFSPVSGLRSAFRSDQEDAVLAQMQADQAAVESSAFGQGLIRGMHRTPAMLANALGQVIEPFSTQYSQPVYDWAAKENQTAQGIYSPAPESFDQINSFGSGVDYVTGAIGENLPNMLATAPLGIAGRIGLRGAALSPLAKNLAATSAAAFPLQMGEMAGSMREDKAIMDTTTPWQRLGTSAAYGALTAPLEAADEALLMGRAMGAGKAVKNVFKDGFGATMKDAAKHVGMAIPESALTEGVPEAIQTETQQRMLSGLNPERDTSRDAHNTTDAFFKGWAAGSGPSAVGRGADVAWAQGRGATEAIKSLLSPKTLPESLKGSDDRSIVDWDNADNEQRNSWAKDIADRIMGSDAAQSLKDSAQSFYDKAAGARDAWTTMSDALGAEEKAADLKASYDRFMSPVREANKAVFGKANAEETPEDKAVFKAMKGHLSADVFNAKFDGGTEMPSNIYQRMKDILSNPDKVEQQDHLDELGKFFVNGTDGVHKAAKSMSDEMRRQGMIDHDETFINLFKQTHEGQLNAHAARKEIIKRYSPYGGEMSDSEVNHYAKFIYDTLRNYDTLPKKSQEAFNRDVEKLFGKNYGKAIEAFSPHNVGETGFETEAESVDDVTGGVFKNKSADEIAAPKTRFLGSGVVHARKHVAEGGGDSLEGHGGFWKLSDGQTAKADKKALTSSIKELEAKIATAKQAGRGTKGNSAKLAKLKNRLSTFDNNLAEMQARFKSTQVDLRNDGHYVRELTPLEYVAEAGVSAEEVAAHLGTTVEGLKTSTARMLAVEERNLEKDKLSLDKDDLLNLADATKQSMSHLPPDILLDGPRGEAIKAAMGLKGGAQRKAMRDLGLEHGSEVSGKKLINNYRHGGNGVFNVHTKDGAAHAISASKLIATMRKRSGQDMSAYQAFNAGVAALMQNSEFDHLSVNNVWGKPQKASKKATVVRNGGKTFVNNKPALGVFGDFFKLEPGLTLGEAHRATQRGQAKSDDITKLEDEHTSLLTALEDLEADYDTAEDIDKLEASVKLVTDRIEAVEDELSVLYEKQAEYEGDGERQAVAGEVLPTSQNVTPTEHNNEQVRDFNDDGTPKHPFAAPRTYADPVSKDFNGVPLKLRPEVKGRDITGAMRTVLAWARRAREIVEKDSAPFGVLDMVVEYVARAAAAQHDSNEMVRDAYITVAKSRLFEVLANETVLADAAGEKAKADKLRAASAELYADHKDYEDNKGDVNALAVGYETYKPRTVRTQKSDKKNHASDRWSHHNEFLATLEGKTDAEIIADGVARKARIEKYSPFLEKSKEGSELLSLMHEEQSLARQELVDRKKGVKSTSVVPADPFITKMGRDAKAAADAKAEKAAREKAVTDRAVEEGDAIAVQPELPKADAAKTKADEAMAALIAEREEKAAKVEPIIERQLSDIEKLGKNVAEAVKNFRAAWGALKASYVKGEFQKADLVKALRSAGSALRAAAGNAYDIIREQVQKFIAEYQKSKAEAEYRTTPISNNGKGYFAVNKVLLTESDMKEVNQKMLRFLKKLQTAENHPIGLKRFNGFVANVEGSEQYGFLPLSVQNQAEVRIFMDAVKQYLIEEGFPVEDSMFVVHGETGYAYMGYHPFTNTFTLSTDALHTVGNLISGENVSDQQRMDFIQSLIHEAAHKMDFVATVSDNPINLSALNEELRHDGFLAKEAVALMKSADKFKNLAWPLSYTTTIAKRGNLFASELFAQLYSAYKLHNADVKSIAPNIHAFIEEVENAKSDEERRAAIAGYLPKDFDGEMERVFQTHGKTYSPSRYISGGTDSSSTKVGDDDQSGGKFNSEGSFANGKAVAQADIDAVKDYVAKVLGPKVKAEFVKDLGGNSAAWNRVNGEAIIRIAVNATNPLSKAHHEAMHEFFQRMLDDGSPVADILRKAANNKLVVRQIEQFFHSNANYATIKAALANDEHERVAYMFQLWAAGQLKLGPQTESVFQKIANFFRKVLGILSADQKAEAIMQSFHDGKMSDANAVAEVLAAQPKLVESYFKSAVEWAKPMATKAYHLLWTAQNTLIESGNKGFEAIGRKFSTETGSRKQEISFMDAKTMKTNQYNDHLLNIMKGHDEKDLKAALDGLQSGVQSNDMQIAKLQSSLRKMLDHLYEYSADAGVKMKKTKDYFPRVWDTAAVSENRQKFIDMLKADHLKSTGKELNPVVAAGIADTIIEGRGHDPVHEDELKGGYTPFMAAANKRALDFISDPAFADFQYKDLTDIMTTYVSQAVHRAEYTRRFGNNGELLRTMVQDAVGEHIGKTAWDAAKTAAEATLAGKVATLKLAHPNDEGAVRQALAKEGYLRGKVQIKHIAEKLGGAEASSFKSFEPELRRQVKAIMALEGTLGADIDPSLRKMSSALIVYENMRLLGMSLFSQVIDPLGTLVRGGTMSDAFNTFKRGMVSTVAAWRGKPLEDSATKLAMRLGIIDAGNFMNSQANTYTSLYMGKTAKKWNDRLFRWNGVEGFSQGTRVGAMEAAIAFIKAHKSLPTENSERWLEELNLTPADIKLVDGELDYSDVKIQQAIFRWVEGAILRPNAAMRPSWASDPHFALIFHMKQFTYASQKVFLERAFNEAKHGNYDPAMNMLMTYVPAMIAADFLRGIIANGGQEPPWKRKWDFGDYLTEGVQRAGLLGVPQLGLDAIKWGPAELGGPVVEQVTKAGKTFAKDIRKDAYLDEVAGFTQAKRDIDRAAQFDGLEHAAKRTLRDALPINSLTKRYVFDEVVGK